MFLGVNFTHRSVFGDISSDKFKDLRIAILGSEKKSFNGIEFNCGFRLNNIVAEFHMPGLRDKGKPVEGLTNTQFLFSIKFIGGFSLKINENKATGQTTPSATQPDQQQ